jgi:tetratricopeptide (TPR) repeat protein
LNTITTAEPQPGLRFFEHVRLMEFQKKKQILALLLFAVCLLAYSQASHFEFVNFDDPQYVTENPHVQMGLHRNTFAWAFTTFEFVNWHPLTWISYLIDYQLFKLNPAGYHFMNVVYHATAAVLLFLVLHRGTGHLLRSFSVAILFAVHPINVESVAWVAERKNVLSAVFWFLAILAYGWYALRPGWKRYGVVLLCFALGLMSKPMVITLPCALLLLDIWPLCRVKSFACPEDGQTNTQLVFARRNWLQLALEKVPMLALSAASAVLTLLAQVSSQSMGPLAEYPMGMRVENAVVSYALYITKAFLPWRFAIFYPYPEHSIPIWKLALTTAFVVGTTIAVISARNRRPYLLVGWFWFLGTLVPVIGLFQNGDQAMADRYAYTPLVGIFVMVVWLFSEWLERSRRRKIAGSIFAVFVAAALAADLHHQLTFWHDSISLFSHAVSVTEKNGVAETNWGEALSSLHREEEATQHYLNALNDDPKDGTRHYNYGRSLFFTGKTREAIAEYDQVLQLGTSPAIMARTYHNLGAAYLSLGNRPDAKYYYQQAASLNSVGYRSFLMLGLLQFEDGELDAARPNLEKSVELMPSDAGYSALGQIYERQGRLPEAKNAFERASQISPDYISVQHSLQEVQRKLEVQKNSVEAATPAAP